jgi:hypothetical protein
VSVSAPSHRYCAPVRAGHARGVGGVDRLLDDDAFFEPYGAHFDPVLGRPSIRIEVLEAAQASPEPSMCALAVGQLADDAGIRRCRAEVDLDR